jgi:uncharacterized RDD family membrane protein YckC
MVSSAQLVTPEAVVLDLPTAGVGSRLLCRGIDILISFLGFSLFVGVVAAASSWSGSGLAVALASLFGSAAVLLVYPALMEGLWGGRTVGKLVLGLRVVRVDGGPITFSQAAVRAAFGLVDVWATLGSLGTLLIFVSRRDQRLGDMVAGTMVLRERRGGRLQPVQVVVPPGCEQLVSTMDVGAMTPGDYELVRSFLVRWNDFGDRQRPVIAAKVAGPLWQRFRHPVPPALGPEYYLACLGAAYQSRRPMNFGERPGAAPGPGEPLLPAPATAPPQWGASGGWAPPG